MSSNKPPRAFLSTETWEKLRSLKEQTSSSPAPKPKKGQERNKDSLTDVKTKSPADFAGNLKKTWQDRRKEHENIIDWLSKTFPEAFSFKHPKPLKLNITADIYPHLPSDGTISKLKLRAAIKHYTHSTAYLKALIKANERVDLQGAVMEPLDPSHKEFTQTLLTQRFEKKKAFKTKKPFKKSVQNIPAQEERVNTDT